MEIAFADHSNREVDRLVGLAEEYMVSHRDGATLYITAFRPEEEEDEDEAWRDEGDALDLT